MKVLLVTSALGLFLAACAPASAPDTKPAPSKQSSQMNPSVDGLVKVKSVHSVRETMNRLEDRVRAKGLTVFDRIDHRANAFSAGLDMKEAQVLIFGNPKIGTPLMKQAPTMAIDLPIRVLVYQDGQGQVWLAYNDPSWLGHRHGVSESTPLQKMSGALAALSAKATAP